MGRRFRRGSVLVFGALILASLVVAGCSREARPGPGLPPSPVPDVATPASGQRGSQPVAAVKIAVGEAGLVQVTREQLAAVGFDLAVDGASHLSLTLAGQPVPFVMDDQGETITFYGQPRQSRYGDENMVWLRRAEGQGAPGERTVSQADDGTLPAITDFADTSVIEEEAQYLSQTPQGTDHWLWQAIYAPDALAVPFDLPGWSGGEADLRVAVWGNTQDYNLEPDHHAVLRVNGQVMADQTWDGKGWQVITATLPADTLRTTANELMIELPNDTGAAVEVVYLDEVGITYPRQLDASAGRLVFSAAAGAPVELSLGPAYKGAGPDGSGVALWDVTDPAAAQPLSGFAVTEEGTLHFRDESVNAARTYALAVPGAFVVPRAIIPVRGVDLRQNPTGADYIAVVHPDFFAALQPLVEYRRSQGLRVTVASIDDVYDTFSDGMPDPAAIRDYVRYAQDNWPAPAPRFLLLVGDASYDYRGFVPGGTPNFVPTYLLSTHFVGETASDNWFVSLDDSDDLPDLAVGRIPAQAPAQVATAVGKTLAYERDADSGPWLDRALFVADNKQAEFQSMSDDLASDYLPAGYAVEKVYLGQAQDASGEILQSLSAGVGLVNYVGHGSMNVWAQEKIFQIGDASRLSNAGALPVMVTMTCLVGYFHHPQASSMGEELLFNPNGGVVAALVPTSETLASDQRYLAEGFYKHLFEDAPTVGEAIMLAKQDLPSERAIMQDLVETFTLLGDPALVLRRGPSSSAK